MNKTIEDYLNDLAWDTPPAVRQEAIRQLQRIDDKDLPLLVLPMGKEHWDGAAEVIAGIGYPGVRSIVPELLVWLQDLNWPGAGVISRFLRDIGEPLVPVLQRVIAEHAADEEWMYWIIHSIVNHWPEELVARLKPELLDMARHSAHDLDAIALLDKHGLESLAVLTALLEQKEQGVLSRMNQLMLEHADVDCKEFGRRFREEIFRPDEARDIKGFMEKNHRQQTYCGQMEGYRNYLQELENTREHIVCSKINKYDIKLSCSLCYPFLAKLESNLVCLIYIYFRRRQDMAEPLKAMYNKEFLRGFAEKIQAAYPGFQQEAFVREAMKAPWEELELKARMRRITETLGIFLPQRYEEALSILYAIDEHCVGFPYLIFPDFVEVFGQGEEHWELSMAALERFTARSSAEFAVRPFLLRDPQRMMEQMLRWSGHPDEHVRRLASEGSRPRLPWGQAIPMFKRDPSPVLPVLEQLKADPSLYVRKSVANNLNDIAKDHPGIVIAIAQWWKGENELTDWIVRHGCRSLIRKAEPEIMELFGYASDSSEAQPLVAQASVSVEPSVLQIGGSCELAYQLSVREGEPVRVRIEYGIDFVKAGGKISRKLFLLSDKTVPGGTTLSGTRTHRWADLTTRRHYPGEHRIALLVNGREAAAAMLMLEAKAGAEQ